MFSDFLENCSFIIKIIIFKKYNFKFKIIYKHSIKINKFFLITRKKSKIISILIYLKLFIIKFKNKVNKQ